MSWMKRRTPTATPSPGLQTTPPPVQMYNPNQHSNSQDWEQQPANSWYNQPAVQAVPTMPTLNESQNSQVLQPNSYWQQQSYSAQSNQHQQQQQYQYGNNTMSQNNYYHQAQPTQTPQTASYEYNNVQYQGYQSYAHNQPTSQYDQGAQSAQPVHGQPHAPQQSDGWNNAWGWGDDDSHNSNNANSAHNANRVADESWNWNVEDNKRDAGNAQAPEAEPFAKVGGGKAAPKPENLETVPLLPSLPAGRRVKSEALTPQWSIESQVSQESSDDILQTSESDKLFSRSSTISHSPVSGHQTPQEAHAGAERVEGFDQEHENKEIVSSVKEEDVKPPLGMATGSTGENPYKRGNGGGSKHRASPGFFMPPASVNQSVNLETVPDNSEAPDFMQPLAQSEPADVKPVVENNEVAPLNERNQYLETGQLSDENDALPPPGLSRMVPGQFGQGDASEPPPGLSRMVLGQNEGAQSTASPPVGLHRMVPGESSSPEARYDEEETSDPELRRLGAARNPPQSRSATIGADTPPAPPAAGGDVERETHLDGANAQDRRDGAPSDVDALASSVRDLTVGENTGDGRPSKSAESGRRLDTDSDLDRASSPVERRRKDDRGERRDKRYSPAREPREREKARPDRRKQRDRGYDDDTDYFSDKEHNRRRDERDRTDGRRDDAEKKYGSLRRGERDRDRNGERRRRDDRERERGSERGGDRRSEYARRERDRERDYYYNRYNDEYDDAHRSSRPSSRSDSMHDSYYRESRGNGGERRRDRDRERERDGRRHRDPYNMYKMPGYPYDAYNPYYQQYQYYLENLRRTDPAAYAELYRKYYGQTGAASSTYTQEEKTSVHSGRSSTNDDLAKERYLRQSYYGHANYSQMGGYYREPQSVSSTHYGLDESSSMLLEDTTVSQRLTPAKFSTAHVKASIASGRLLKILPHYPMDGQAALVELERLQDVLRADDELVELEQFPGPLARGVTHKKTIIEYCNNKIRGIREGGARREVDDPESYILMWELLILLIRQNGMVVGADIAELLMKDRNPEAIVARPASVASNSSGIVEFSESSIPPDANASAAGAPASPALKEEHVTRKFREFLLYGSVQQALEWAMKNSLWGHALFLASKLDKRTYAKVMTRFANGLPMNDPLQTLYQLLSGHLPAAVTSVSDEKWGDWRPHLAMILSNTMRRPELDRKAITTLGDTLMGRGSLYAAQFCYLMAEVGFSRYGRPDAKLVLLGGDPSKPFPQCAHNEAIHMTEIYEYACSLNDASFTIPQFQAHKYLLATRLADRGFLESALAYVEQVSIALAANPTVAQPSLINRVCDLADRLKFYDPADYQDADDAGQGQERPEQSWLRDLKAVQQQYTMGLISHESVNNLATMTPDAVQGQAQAAYDHSPQDPWSGTNQAQYGEHGQQYDQQAPTQSWQPHVAEAEYSQQAQQVPQQDGHLDNYNAYQEQTWNNQSHAQWSPDQAQQQSPLEAQHVDPQQMHPQPAANDYWNNAQIEPEEAEAAKDDPDQQTRPQISMPNQGRQARISERSDDGQGQGPGEAKKAKDAEKKPAAAAPSSTGWFGGIFSKFALKPKNQMKLPDDKNPTIVWDQEKKRWINLDEDNGDGAAELKPPPKMADMMPAPSAQPPAQQPQQQQQQPQSLPGMNQFGGMPSLPSQPQSLDPAAHPQNDAKPPLPAQNMFKMQRGRNLKKSYVDVFNPSGKAPGPGTSADFTPPTMPASNPAPMNFFVPAPMDANAPVDFLTPSGASHQDPNMQMSRWSSSSSLSKEVQSYMRPKRVGR